MAADAHQILIIGGGPAGLRAAEVANTAGVSVTLCEAQRSVGHKFLVAGRGGLNLTHGEPVENFPSRYGAETERWRDLLGEFGKVLYQAKRYNDAIAQYAFKKEKCGKLNSVELFYLAKSYFNLKDRKSVV